MPRKKRSASAKALAQKHTRARVHIPTRIQRKVASIVQTIIVEQQQRNEQTPKSGTKKDDTDGSSLHASLKSSPDNTTPQEQLADAFEKALARQLKLVHLDSDEIQQLFTSTTTKNASTDDTELSESLTSYATNAWNQQQLAFQVFQYLDHGGKGVIVVQDLQQVADEFLNTNNDNPLDLDDLHDMMALAGASDGLLSKEDFVKIARQINLQNV